ncbi:hypothetical protein BX281_4181 [Streptomyces sp. Ag82_O1-15]|uniref:hypothetical protein n=1 Tax=Streptomyces sp. Ag82_O1-15 TaxID=1938855 RepID=UPI000BD1286F|nr:hypothetical protein [Streptomyces sp. Ag82_O1-15]PBC96168.1 hypothetical protein BX281_4157 [Streptomyces sp. Ag82_O1-15]PBC96190.1 hypothetical protein BX281_4181 [Streptomyces sp. Ag82_O1-15]
MSGSVVRLLVWRDALHFDRFEDLPCVLCGKPTPMRSHTDEPVHKVCAEQWNHTHPDAARYRAGARDLGTRRFHDDAPTPSKQTTVRHLPQRPAPEAQTLQLPSPERKTA